MIAAPSFASWIIDEQPTESGYYLTFYFNEEENDFFFKAFWFNVDKSKWIWRLDPDVKTWWNVRHDYYVPCQMQEGVAPLPKQIIKESNKFKNESKKA